MPSKHQKKTSYVSNLLILLGLMAVTFILLFREGDLSVFLKSLTHSNPLWLAAGLGCMFLFVSCEALNMYQISHALNFPITFPRCEQYAFVGFYFSSITPSASGGQPMQVYYMKKDRLALADASLMILYIVMVYQIAMLLLALISSLFYPARALETIHQLGILFPFGCILNGGAVLIPGLLIFSRSGLQRILFFFIRIGNRIRLIKSPDAALEKICRSLDHYRDSARRIRSNPRLFFRVLSVSLLQMGALSLVPYCVYRSLGAAGFRPGELMTCQSLLTLSASAVPTPGSVGAAEGGFLLAFKSIFEADQIKTAMLLSRGISLYLFLMISLAVCLFTHLRTSKTSELS